MGTLRFLIGMIIFLSLMLYVTYLVYTWCEINLTTENVAHVIWEWLK